jgi:uncharacterized membrane protein
MMDWFQGGMMDGWDIFGWLMMFIPILLWGSLLTVIVWAVARIFPNRRAEGERPETPEGRTDQAEEILRVRFARDEIDAEEFQCSLESLRGGAIREGKEPNLG